MAEGPVIEEVAAIVMIIHMTVPQKELKITTAGPQPTHLNLYNGVRIQFAYNVINGYMLIIGMSTGLEHCYGLITSVNLFEDLYMNENW